MSFKLCTAEKPSVARDIARVVGASERHNGYYQGNGYIVTWAVGHLVGLAEPDAYGFVKQDGMYSRDELMQKAYAELPLIPSEFQLVVLESTKAQFNIIKELMHRPDVVEIVDCGDMGAEGHILQWFIREKAGCKKPVKRFCATSMTDEAIRDAMNDLRDANDFSRVIQGEFCKKKEDWILGMSFSRALSIKYHAGINVGRVQSPTLGFVVKRYLDVVNFKVTDYYTLDATLDGFHVFWNKDVDGVFATQMKNSDGRVLNRIAIADKCDEIKNARTGIVSKCVTVKKAIDRPQLYDITELQRDANRKYGYSAALTLDTAQALYETQKVLSYPRTDSRYITSDLVPYMEERIRMIGGIEKYGAVAAAVLGDKLNIDKKIVNDSKVTDHHALIVTKDIAKLNIASLKPTDEERQNGVTASSMKNVLDLVISRMLVSFSYAYRYEQTDVTVSFANSMNFSASGKKPLAVGWKSIQSALSGREDSCEAVSCENAEQLFTNVHLGQSVTVRDCRVVEANTNPPTLHTEATLLTAMENAGQNIENGSVLKGHGIGTQATRAGIIKKLFDNAAVETEMKGKTPYIKPTKKGLNIIRVLPPELYSPKITADWETKIAQIVDGTVTESKVMSDFDVYIKDKMTQVKELRMDVSFAVEKESYGDCPWCGAAVYRFQERNDKGKITETRYYCGSKCGWGLKPDDLIFAIRLRRKLSDAEVKKFISKKSIVLDCVTVANGSKYRAEFTFVERVKEDKRYCNVKCTPVLSDFSNYKVSSNSKRKGAKRRE